MELPDRAQPTDVGHAAQPPDRRDVALVLVAERLRRWTERLQAYERLESVLAQRESGQSQQAAVGSRPLSEAVERGLSLVS